MAEPTPSSAPLKTAEGAISVTEVELTPEQKRGLISSCKGPLPGVAQAPAAEPLLTERERKAEMDAFSIIEEASFDHANAYCESGDSPRAYKAALDSLRRVIREQIARFSRGNHADITQGATVNDSLTVESATPALPATEDSSAGEQAQADPMDWPLPCDVTVGCVTICKGVKLRTLVTRMEVLHKMATAQAEVQAEPVAWAAVYFGGKRAGKIYNTCDTQEQALEYINLVEQSNDSITLTAKPVFFAAAPQAQPADAREVVGDLAYALDLLVGSDPMHSLCQQEAMDVLGRVKGTWSAAAEANARATLKTHAATLAAMAAAQEGNAAKGV